MEINEFEKRVKGLMNIKLNENKKKVNGFGCVMLYVDFPEMKKEIQKEIVEDDIYIDPNDNSFGLEKSSHISLFYGLWESVKDEQVKKIINSYDFLDIIFINNISLFENEKYDVLKFEVEKEKYLLKCNKELSKLPNTNEYKTYNPHITIAYLKPGKGDKYVKMFKDNSYEVKPTKVVYTKIDGSEVKLS